VVILVGKHLDEFVDVPVRDTGTPNDLLFIRHDGPHEEVASIVEDPGVLSIAQSIT